MLSVRTNNDIEGWHHALNRRAAGRCGTPFYCVSATQRGPPGVSAAYACVLAQAEANPESRLPPVTKPAL